MPRIIYSLSIFCSVLLITLTGCSYTPRGASSALREYSYSRISKEVTLCLPQKWFYIDRAGKVALPQKFRTADSFADGIAIAGIGQNDWELVKIIIDRSGKPVTSLGFKDITPSTESYFVVKGPSTTLNGAPQKLLPNGVLPGARQTYYSLSDGLWRQSYSQCGQFCQGVAIVKVDPSSEDVTIKTISNAMPTSSLSKFFLINKAGTRLKAIDGEPLNESLDFNDGLQPASKNGKIGFLDTTGNWAITPAYASAENFHDSIARVTLPGTNSKWYFIDKNGKKLFDKEFEQAGDFHEGLAKFGDNNKDLGFINKTGHVVIKATPNVKRFSNFSEGKASFITNNLEEGFIDAQGKTVIPPKSAIHFSDFHDGRCKAQTVNKTHSLYGFIDTSGNWIIKPTYKKACDFADGLAAVEEN